MDCSIYGILIRALRRCLERLHHVHRLNFSKRPTQFFCRYVMCPRGLLFVCLPLCLRARPYAILTFSQVSCLTGDSTSTTQATVAPRTSNQTKSWLSSNVSIATTGELFQSIQPLSCCYSCIDCVVLLFHHLCQFHR